MRSFILPTMIVELLAAPMALASITAKGSITSVTKQAMTVMRDNGIPCRLPQRFKTSAPHTGERWP